MEKDEDVESMMAERNREKIQMNFEKITILIVRWILGGLVAFIALIEALAFIVSLKLAERLDACKPVPTDSFTCMAIVGPLYTVAGIIGMVFFPTWFIFLISKTTPATFTFSRVTNLVWTTALVVVLHAVPISLSVIFMIWAGRTQTVMWCHVWLHRELGSPYCTNADAQAIFSNIVTMTIVIVFGIVFSFVTIVGEWKFLRFAEWSVWKN